MEIDGLHRSFIHDKARVECLRRSDFDRLMSEGWRNFGCDFFRYNLGLYRDRVVNVIPLRVRLSEFRLSQSQRRVLKKNSDLEVVVGPMHIDDDVIDLFYRHRRRFTEYPPESIYEFLSDDPDKRPVEGLQVNVRNGEGKLLAVGLANLGDECLSAIYSCFAPEEKRRSLGIYLILKEIEHARSLRLKYFYHGYVYNEPSFYDYKKRFFGLEAFDWNGRWLPFERMHA